MDYRTDSIGRPGQFDLTGHLQSRLRPLLFDLYSLFDTVEYPSYRICVIKIEHAFSEMLKLHF